MAFKTTFDPNVFKKAAARAIAARPVHAPCPKCGRRMTAYAADFAAGKTIKCPGCGNPTKLVDTGGHTRKLLRP